MLATKTILTHFQHIEPRLMDIVFEIRNIIAGVFPAAAESIHKRGMTYFDASRGGHVSANICQIVIFDDHVRLAFIQGAFLPDPRHLLREEEGRIAMRFIEIHNYESAPWEDFKELIKASVAFDPYNNDLRPLK
jgi:hypothetical protein